MSDAPPGGEKRIRIEADPPPGADPYAHFQPILDELSRWGNGQITYWTFQPREQFWYARVRGQVDAERAARTFDLPAKYGMVVTPWDMMWSIGNPHTILITDQGKQPGFGDIARSLKRTWSELTKPRPSQPPRHRH